MNIGKVLTELRKKRGMSRQNFADEFDISVHTYIKYENGSVKPPYETLCKIADFYNVSTDYLLGRNPSTPEYLTESEKELEECIIEKYRQLPESFRKEFLQGVIDAVRRQTGGNHIPQIQEVETIENNAEVKTYPILTAARRGVNGEHSPMTTEYLTAEEIADIINAEDGDDDL